MKPDKAWIVVLRASNQFRRVGDSVSEVPVTEPIASEQEAGELKTYLAERYGYREDELFVVEAKPKS